MSKTKKPGGEAGRRLHMFGTFWIVAAGSVAYLVIVLFVIPPDETVWRAALTIAAAALGYMALRSRRLDI